MSQPPATEPAVLSVSWLTDAVQQIFLAVGYSPLAARTVAESLVDADLRGVASHGALLVPMYVERIQRGSVSRAESAEVLYEFGAVATLDAHHGLGQLSGDQAMRMAIAKARSFGVGAVTVRNAFHFGAAFRYANAAADAGCLGVAAANTRPLMPAPGGAKPVVGNNPLAVAVPLPNGPSIVLDMALSEAALGKIRLAAQEGRSIPATWATDATGRPTTDPVAALDGMLLPTGGPKGYGLALMVDVLTGVLSGGAFGAGVQGLYADTTVPNNCAHFFLAIDPGAFGAAEDFARNALRLADEIKASPTKPGTDCVYLPGQLEHERAETAARSGIRIDGGVLAALHKTAESLRVELASPSS
ncbi:Ldh family oxidoreductase [Streptomyces sp. ISID311]|uniref:Ldh family oxidoreductase n=1 Tax=Streptomyces sp. ISID311 TaxID=2601673 RepID=UPI0011BD3D24|nr:Ldh family oxidoreductase [Streptomyces sp. ISID311]TXC99922.1 Ldh family oxidoreductase [Streptomyces sp. ISID311]